MKCVFHTGFFVHGNSKGETRERCRYPNNSKRVIRNLEERNVGTKGKSPNDVTSAEVLTMELPEGRESL